MATLVLRSTISPGMARSDRPSPRRKKLRGLRSRHHLLDKPPGFGIPPFVWELWELHSIIHTGRHSDDVRARSSYPSSPTYKLSTILQRKSCGIIIMDPGR